MAQTVLAAVAALWASVLLVVYPVDSAPAASVHWERSFIAQDSLVVPASWIVPCDDKGCAEAFRVTWLLATPQGNDQATSGVVLADRTLVVSSTTAPRFRDSVRVPYGDYGEPRTICVQVVALRRQLASAATSGCRTIERPDAPPPGIDSIAFDTLPWTYNESVADSLVPQQDISHVSLYQYRDYLAPDTGWRTDSLPVGSDSAHPVVLTLGYHAAPCALVQHIDRTTLVLASTQSMLVAPRQELRRVMRCAARARVEHPGRPLRYHAATDLVFRSGDTTVVRLAPFLDERYLRYQLRDALPPASSGA